MAARDKMIAAMAHSNRALYDEFKLTERTTEAVQTFIHSSGRFPLRLWPS